MFAVPEDGKVRIDQKALVGSMTLVMTVGAARKDASYEQLNAIRDQVVPLLGDKDGIWMKHGDSSEALGLLQFIMGPTWKPSGEYAEYIEKLNAPKETT